jgi:predicted dehydrogenase
MARALQVWNIPYRVTLVADPRGELIRANDDGFLADTKFVANADQLLEQADQLDGVMIGTRCNLHTELACKVARTGLPLFLEKPVAITFEQLQQLAAAFANYPAPTVVSFPLRLSPILQQVKAIVDSGEIGTVEHLVANNDVPYGGTYFRTWHRDIALNGGLFLQKATHDLDYITYLLGQKPRWISATKAQRVYGGTMPWDLQCKDCALNEECPESPLVRFRHGYERSAVQFHETYDYCVFSEGIEIEDINNCLIEYDGGAQVSYTQNVFARYQAQRRGARLLGYHGTVEFDWYQNQIKLYSHRRPTVQTIDFTGDMPHFGGDRELGWDWLLALRDGKPSRSSMTAGIDSALTCLWAKRAAEERQVFAVTM